MKRNQGKESYWRGVMRRQAKSRLTVRDFCSEEGVSENSYYFWRRELASRDQKSENVTGHSPRKQRNGEVAPFFPVAVRPEAPCVLELRHPSGYELRIPAGFDPGTLQQVIAVLEQNEERP